MYQSQKTYNHSLKVVLPDHLYQKIMWWIRKAEGECSGFGRVVFKDGLYHVTSAFLLKQTNSAAETEIEGADLAKALYETRNDQGEMNWWWHSHVNMGVFWSGTDREAIELIGNQGYCLATVFNKREESHTAFYRKSEGTLPALFMDGLDLEIPRHLPKALTDAWDKEFEEKCVKKPVAQPPYGVDYWATRQLFPEGCALTDGETDDLWTLSQDIDGHMKACTDFWKIPGLERRGYYILYFLYSNTERQDIWQTPTEHGNPILSEKMFGYLKKNPEKVAAAKQLIQARLDLELHRYAKKIDQTPPKEADEPTFSMVH